MTDEATPAYAMVQINMKDPEEFMERYAQHVMPILAAWDVKMIAGTMAPSTIERLVPRILSPIQPPIAGET